MQTMFCIYFEKCSACCSWMESSISSSSRLLVSCMASGINLTGMLKEWTEDRQTDKNMTKWAVCTLMERRQGERQHIYVYKREGLASLGRRSLQGDSHSVQSSRRKLQLIASAHTAQVWTNRGTWTRGMVCYSHRSKVLVFDIMVPVSAIHIP